MKIIIDPWVVERLNRVDRDQVRIVFSNHAKKDKNLDFGELAKTEETVRKGRIEFRKSNRRKRRICLKHYFKEDNKTYFVIIKCLPTLIMVITVIKKKGKY